MRELFYEESSICKNIESEKTKYKICKGFSIGFYALIVLWGIIIYNSFIITELTLISVFTALAPMVGFFLAGFFIGKRKNRYCNDYDYTLVSGSVRISKVINGIKRVHLYNFETSEIQKIGKITDERFSTYQRMPDVKIERMTANSEAENDKSFYYFAVASINTSLTVLILECTDKFIANVLQFTNRTVFRKD